MPGESKSRYRWALSETDKAKKLGRNTGPLVWQEKQMRAMSQEKITENINDFLPENSRGTQTNIRDITCIRRRTHCSAEPD